MTAMLPPVLAYGITCAALGVGLGVPLGRWSALFRWPRRRQLPRRVTPAVHAGCYVVPRSVSNGVEALADRQFRVR